MSDASKVLITLKLIGAGAAAGDARVVSASLKEIGAAGEDAGHGMNSASRSSTTASSAFGRLHASASGAERVILGLGTAIKEVAKGTGLVAVGGLFGLGEATKEAAGFQKAMEMVHTQAGATQSEVTRMSSAVLHMAGSVGTGPSTLAQGIYEVESAGYRGAKALSILRTAAIGAKVGGADLKDVTDALDGAIVSGMKGVKNYGQAMGVLNATVGTGTMNMQDLASALGTGLTGPMKRYGVDLQDVSAALAVFGDNNIRGAKAGTMLASAIRIMAAPSDRSASVLATLGLKATTLADDLRKPGGLVLAIQDLQKHLKASGETASQQARTLTMAFGGKQSTGVQLLIGQLGRLQSKYGAVGRGAGQLGAAWAATKRTVSYQFDALKSEFTAIADMIGLKVLPVATNALGVVTKLVSKIANGRGTIGQFVAGLTSSRAPAATVPRTRVAGQGGFRYAGAPITPPSSAATAGFSVQREVVAAVNGTVAIIKKAIPIVKSVITQVIGALKPAMPFITNVLLPALKGIGEGMIGGIVVTFKAAIPIIKVIAEAFGLIGRAAAPVTGIIQKVSAVFGFVATGALASVARIAEVLIGKLRALGGPIKSVGNAFKDVAGVIAGVATKAFHAAENIIGKVIGVFSNPQARGQLLAAAGHVLSAPLDYLASIPGQVAKLASGFISAGAHLGSSLVTAIVNAIKNAPGDVVQAIEDLIPAPLRGPLETLLGLGSSAVSSVASTVSGAANDVKHLLKGLTGVTVRDPADLFHSLVAPGAPAHTRVKSQQSSRQEPKMVEVTSHYHHTTNLTLELDGRVLHRGVFHEERRLVEAL